MSRRFKGNQRKRFEEIRLEKKFIFFIFLNKMDLKEISSDKLRNFARDHEIHGYGKIKRKADLLKYILNYKKILHWPNQKNMNCFFSGLPVKLSCTNYQFRSLINPFQKSIHPFSNPKPKKIEKRVKKK